LSWDMPDSEAEAPPPRACASLCRRVRLRGAVRAGLRSVGIEAFVDHYNHQRHHESINNLTPSDVYFGRDKEILRQRERTKRKTLETRRLHHRQNAA
jgi:putative transposase